MKINTNPVRGTVDYLPAEMEVRQMAIDKILKTFKDNGFLQVKTPILESLSNLTTGDSGDNQKLMFKTVKRGEKLNLNKPNLTEADIVEEGLRYDLTVPLARLYAGNKEKLITPFKTIQIDESFRAERPQKGRNRQFTQCDIDIWGDASIFAEVEVMTTLLAAYKAVGLDNVVLKVNDRRILSQLVQYAGFEESDVNSVCVTVDKLDKIGTEGVKKELCEKFAHVENIFSIADELATVLGDLQGAEASALKPYNVDQELIDNLQTIIDVVGEVSGCKVAFDVTIVRGQGYYTGTVFEAFALGSGFTRAIGGGGRYDKMLERFLGTSVPAVGFGIGLDSVLSVLTEQNAKVSSNRYALIYPKGASVQEVFVAKQQLVSGGKQISAFADPKNFRNFCEKLKLNGFAGIIKLAELDKVIEL